MVSTTQEKNNNSKMLLQTEQNQAACDLRHHKSLSLFQGLSKLQGAVNT